MSNEKVLVDIKILEQILRIGIKQFTLSTFSNSLYITRSKTWKRGKHGLRGTKFPRFPCVPRIPHFRAGLFERRYIFQGGYSQGDFARRAITRGLLPGGYFPWGLLSMGAIARGLFSMVAIARGLFSMVAIARGLFSMVAIARGAIVRGAITQGGYNPGGRIPS